MTLKEELKMFLLTVLLVSLVFPLSMKATCTVPDKTFPTNRNGDKFTNMVVKGTDTIYVAENGFVHTLDASLNHMNNFSTCVGDGCTNINKVLSVLGDKLVLCGTGNNGICQVWSGTQFIYNSSTTEAENYLVVSSDIDRPAVGLVHGKDLFIGVTYGAGIKTTENTYKYLVSRRGIEKSFTTYGSVDLKDNINENYLVYFKKVFEHEGFIYFLTNQRLKIIVSEGYVSKLVRMCINETIKTELEKKLIKSYTDISMSCNVDGVDYNLLQDAEFLPGKGVLVAAFAKGDNPENLQPGSAICIYTIDTVNDAILKSKENFIACNATTGSIDRQSAYLDIELQQCLTLESYLQLKDDDYICPKGGRGTKVIGTISLEPTKTYRIEDTNITIKTVKGVERYSLYPDVFLGTDEGSMITLMGLDKYQLDWVCRHLGHTKSVHKSAYQQMSGMIERVYISKIMLIQDLNLTSKYRGQDLANIDVFDILSDNQNLTSDPELTCGENTDLPVECESDIDNWENEGSCSDEDSDFASPPVKRSKKVVQTSRKKWSDKEIDEINKYFESFLSAGITPRQDSIKRAQEKSKKANGEIWKRKGPLIVKKISNMNKKKK